MCTVKLFGPVAFFASLPGRPEVANGHRNGSRVGVEEHGEDLGKPRNLRFHIPRNPCTHMAVHAGDPCMGAIQIGRIFRLHHLMAQFPAEGIGIGEEVSVVAYEAQQDRKETSARQKDGEFPPLTPIIEIEDRIGQCFFEAKTAATTTLPKQPVKKYQDAQEQENRKDHVG